jgi:hypothetical protein
MLSKRCFKCGLKLPKIMFQINTAKHKIPSDLGVMVNCRLCTIKYHFKLGGTYTLTHGFQKASKFKIILESLKK